MAIVHLDTGGGGDGEGPSSEAEFLEALRLRAADGLERAYEFLSRHGDAWVRLRARVLCEGAPASELADALAAAQEPDGRIPTTGLISGGALGFPPTPPELRSDRELGIVGTLEALLMAGDAKLLRGDWVEAAARFLERSQDADGAFRITTVGDAVAQEKAAVFFTGMTAGILGRTPVTRPSLLDAAGAFLGARFEPGAVEHEGYPALLAYANFFTNVAHELSDEALQWCGRALEKGFRSRQIDGVSTLRVLLTCDAQAMPGADFEVVELLERVLEEQAGDGGFAELSPGGPETRTTQTFDGMFAIVRLCGALGD